MDVLNTLSFLENPSFAHGEDAYVSLVLTGIPVRRSFNALGILVRPFRVD
jgi:hypothetical protein